MLLQQKYGIFFLHNMKCKYKQKLLTEMMYVTLNNKENRHPLNGRFSRTTWVSQHQKGKTILDIIKQDMMGWQRQLEHVRIICTLLQTDNHVSTSSLNILQAGCSS